MRNYILNSVLAGYLALAGISDSYAKNTPRIISNNNKPIIEETLELPLNIFIPVPEIPETKFNLPDYFRTLYFQFRLLLDENKQPTLAPVKGLERKI